MPEYIERDELIRDFSEAAVHCLHWDKKGEARGYIGARELVMSKSSADVAPVQHGYWIKTDKGLREYTDGTTHRIYACDCSICGFHTGNQGTRFIFCPMCGTKMDGDGQNG